MSADETTFLVFISLVGGLAIVGTLVAGAVAITRIATQHRERMARIGMGLDPDAPEALSGPAPDQSRPANASSNAWSSVPASREQASRKS
jgi:hypothetical protein